MDARLGAPVGRGGRSALWGRDELVEAKVQRVRDLQPRAVDAEAARAVLLPVAELAALARILLDVAVRRVRPAVRERAQMPAARGT